MKDLSAALRLDRMKSGNPAVYLLREQFESFVGSPRRVDLCVWIASCFLQLGQYGDAGGWYETAGQLVLAGPSSPPVLKAMMALDEYEKALDCYRQTEDEDSASRCSDVLAQLRRASAPA